MPDQSVIQLSGDGSHTVVSKIFEDVTYHSRHGAIAESNIVFIDAGLKYHFEKGKDNISIFEMGFGTGLNALLSFLWSKENKIRIDYQTVEAYPIDATVFNNLNYTDILGERQVFESFHNLDWNQSHIITELFNFKKHLSLIEDLSLDKCFDVVFYDAFAPSSQPYLWELPILNKMYQILNDGGVLVSYCAQGAFKRNLKSCGFTIESIPGPPGKREMTRAIKIT
jgi:tRNA U34 5-methylaminomethyl-2-thiouridine-forming methyltransferase MnmC